MSDLIDRARALAICDNALDLWHGMLGSGVMKTIRDKIAELPSVQPSSACSHENDLISRQDAIDALCRVCSIEADYHKCDGYQSGSRWCDEVTAIRELPSAQPEIIRCKDCGYWAEESSCTALPNYHQCLRTLAKITTTADDFCSYAERRDVT